MAQKNNIYRCASPWTIVLSKIIFVFCMFMEFVYSKKFTIFSFDVVQNTDLL
ncbi:hypothetical protein EXN66_Car022264 [Channa argus]|uniref:Uncharacterized protein n=1 Tax=Channa argus TaxID=215402 RepID=A0A6G1QVD8_CHAAH|nr:hypothetical protein EXN66_Car022264 [Channa argus]